MKRIYYCDYCGKTIEEGAMAYTERSNNSIYCSVGCLHKGLRLEILPELLTEEVIKQKDKVFVEQRDESYFPNSNRSTTIQEVLETIKNLDME